MSLLTQIFTWWNGQTLGTRWFTFRKGRVVGTDEVGNIYYESRDGAGRRWVIYNGVAEPSRVPPGWHGWLHHTFEDPPDEDPPAPPAWRKPHQPNLTGTPAAYRPSGSLLKTGERPRVTGDYDAWRPKT